MPHSHTSTFQVRYDECDIYGHVNHANYLRYMQTAAINAAVAVGFDASRYEALGQLWLVRESDVTYLAPLLFGDHVEVETWVMDFRRVRSRRAYVLRRKRDGETIAQAQTDWVYVDRETLRPVSIPQAQKEAFLPSGPPADAPSREPFPEAPPAPSGKFTITRRVQWSDVDPTGHVNNAVYLSYFEDCAVRDAESRGWPVDRMLNEGHFAIVARRYRIEYRQAALPGDELEISTWISDVKRATAVRHYTMHRRGGGPLLARAWALWVWVDPQTGRPQRVHPRFVEDFAANIVA
jgi:acyl-CoA thioester hydrolase